MEMNYYATSSHRVTQGNSKKIDTVNEWLDAHDNLLIGGEEPIAAIRAELLDLIDYLNFSYRGRKLSVTYDLYRDEAPRLTIHQPNTDSMGWVAFVPLKQYKRE